MQQGPRHNVNDLVPETDLHVTSHEPPFQYEELSPKLLCFQFQVWHSKLLCLNFQIPNCYSKISKLAIQAGVHMWESQVQILIRARNLRSVGA